MVTSRPSRIHTVPRPTSTIQCQRAHGSRSSRAGIRVSTILPSAIDSVAMPASAVGSEGEDPPGAEVENPWSWSRSGLAAELALDIARVAGGEGRDPRVAHFAHDPDARVEPLLAAVADQREEARHAGRVLAHVLDDRLEA